MITFSAGRFKVECGEHPYPIWTNIYYESVSEPILMISHGELHHLHAVIELAMKNARIRLGKDANEV